MQSSNDRTQIATTLARARALLDAGQFGEAAKLARNLLEEVPADARAWRLMSAVHLRGDRVDQATLCLQRAMACDPDDVTTMIQLGQCLARLARRREALAIADHVAGLPLDRPALDDGLGTLFSHCDEPLRALPFFERAVACMPESSDYLYNLSTAQRMVGDIVASEASLGRVIAADQNHVSAHFTLADLCTQTPDRNHIDRLLRAIERVRPARSAEITLSFALAKELEDVGDYERSFRYLRRGCNLQRSCMSYDVAADIATIDRIVERHDAQGLAASTPGDDNDEAIFVIGLPRSGTTLVERILSAHSDVKSAGELPAFAQQAVQMVQESASGTVSKLEFVDRSRAVDPRQLGQRYIAATRPQTGTTLRFVDKMPLNYLYAGLIHRALPRARIVALVRDPMDSCYAMYKTLFTAAYPFSYDLDDLGRYYCAWDRLMRHWEATLGDSLLIVRYEDLVSDQEAVSRRLVSHCGLDWQDACLSFHEQRGAVATASAVQVRRPVYATSVGKWRFYAEQLAALRRHVAALDGWGSRRL